MGDRTPKEWGRVAVELPGWRWMPGMLLINADGPVRIDAVDGEVPGLLRRCRWTNEVYVAEVRCGPSPDPDDPGTGGCLLALLGDDAHGVRRMNGAWVALLPVGDSGRFTWAPRDSLGRACIALAEAIGKWPGGAK